MSQKFGRFEVIKELGRGGMATVFLAHDPRFQRDVAVKVLPPQFTHDPRFLDRFQQEARTIAGLEHFAIVPVYDFGEENNAPYLVMRYMAGGSLRERMSGEPLPLAEIGRILQRLAPALDKAHGRGIIHRDLKPGNVLFDEDDLPYLADFGIARMAEATHTMTIIGTPAYMSPEQVIGQQELDGRSDIYALGVMLYEMLCGSQPYESKSPTGQMFMHVNEKIPVVLEANPNLPPQAQAVIEKAMAKDREERYGTAVELAKAVHALQDVLTAVSTSAVPEAETIILKADELEGEEQKIDEIASFSSKPATAFDTPPAVKRKPQDEYVGISRQKTEASRIPTWLWWAGGIIAVIILLVYGISIYFGREGAAVPAEEAPSSTGNGQEGAAQPVDLPEEAALGSSKVRPQDNMRMLFVPAGTFPMGSEGGDGDEKPVHDVTLDSFWIDETEVTNAQYSPCVDAGKCARSKDAGDETYNGDVYPVVGVSWGDADAYCRWAGGQLPSEAQWEYAVRGPVGNAYPWGDQPPNCELAQYVGCGGNTIPVGSNLKGASWVGAHDLAGNVWEWVNDWYAIDYYNNSLAENPEGPENGDRKTLRGGGWGNAPTFLRGANRVSADPAIRNTSLGFRCIQPGS